MTKIYCKKHDVEVEISDGCPQCIAEREAQEAENEAVNSSENIKARIEEATQTIKPEVADALRSALGESLPAEIPVQQEPLSDEEEAAIMAEGDPVVKVSTPVILEYDLMVEDMSSLVAQANAYLNFAQGRVVNSPVSAESAISDLALIANTKKAINAKRKEYLDPINKKASDIRDFFKLLLEPIEQADSITRKIFLDYSAKVDRQRVEAERLEAEALQLAKDQEELTGEHTVDLTPVDKPAETLRRVETAVGTASKTGTWKYKVVDFALVSDDWKVIDSSGLTARARKHHDAKPVPGVEFYFEPGLVVRSK